MNIWIALWALLSSIIIGLFLWSVIILYQQKKAWAAFAKKNGLEYTPHGLMESPSVQGIYNGYRMTMFGDSVMTPDVRGERFLTVIEFDLGAGLPTGAAIGTRGMRPFIEGRSFTHIVRPDHPKWKDEYTIKARDKSALLPYLTSKRLEALIGIFDLRTANILYFFDELDCVLHIETSDPMRDARRIEGVMNRLIAAIRILDWDAERAAGRKTQLLDRLDGTRDKLVDAPADQPSAAQ